MKPERIQLRNIEPTLHELDGWKNVGRALRRTFRFPSVNDALALVEFAAKTGEGKHDVIVEIHGQKVTVTIAAAPGGAFTAADLAFAKSVEPVP